MAWPKTIIGTSRTTQITNASRPRDPAFALRAVWQFGQAKSPRMIHVESCCSQLGHLAAMRYVRSGLRIQRVDATHYSKTEEVLPNAAQTENPLHGESEGLDVGSLAERRLPPSNRSTV